MAAPRNGNDGTRKRDARSGRRSNSSSPARSSPLPIRSHSPRPKRKYDEERELELNRVRDSDSIRHRDRETRDSRDAYRDRGRSRDKDYGSRHRDHHRDRDRDRERDRDRDRNRDRNRDGDRFHGDEDHPRDKRGREREAERVRDRHTRARRSEASSRSPPRYDRRRSPSPADLRHKTELSPPPRASPRHQRSSRHELPSNAGNSAAAREEDDAEIREGRNRDNPSPEERDSLARMKEIEAALDAKETNKEKPSFAYSGKLAAETNKVKGVTLQFTEPPEARKPSTRWRLYVFKDGEPLSDPLYIHRQTCYLFGRERRVADIPTDHPSCSKQHAVIQFRLTEKEDADGLMSSKVRPYVMDLGSTNGTLLNGEKVEPQRYYELFEKDTVKFGNSSREYVLLHEHSAD